MKSLAIAIALFGTTAAVVATYPHVTDLVHKPALQLGIDQQQATPSKPHAMDRPKIDVIFALDTTGSMGGLIEAAKEKIWSIATTLSRGQPAPEIRIGLVAYRDRGDAYVTQVHDLSTDLDSLYATLMDFQADGGGDGPESVNQALDDAVNKVSWSQDANAYKVVFLVGDAPPHMDYQDDVKYPQILAQAAGKGIVVNTIQAGNQHDTQLAWMKIAQAGSGKYAQVAQSGNAVVITTPYDDRLAALSSELDDTRMYYGSGEEKVKRMAKQEAARKLHESASVSSRARRATFNATESGKANLLGEGELVADVAAGRVDIDALPVEALPAPLQAMAPADREVTIRTQAERREKLQAEIESLSAQRTAFLKQKVEVGGGAKSSLDRKLYDAIREQAADKGLNYEEDALAY